MLKKKARTNDLWEAEADYLYGCEEGKVAAEKTTHGVERTEYR
jgi:hypothetical protein